MKFRYLIEAFANMEGWLQSAVSKKMSTFIVFIEGFILSLFTIPHFDKFVTFMVAIAGGFASMFGKDLYTFSKARMKKHWPVLKSKIKNRRRGPKPKATR